MNRTLGGGYHEDERGHYVFSYSDNEGKNVDVRFRAEPDYDLDIIFQEFRNFLIATNHNIDGQIGELPHEDDYDDADEPTVFATWTEDSDAYREAAVQNFQSVDKFTMEHFPNNGWPFGGLTTTNIAALTTADIAPLTVTNLETNQTYAYKDRLMQNPTMAPLTPEQVQSWSLPTQQQIDSWRTDAPGTIGGAKVSYK